MPRRSSALPSPRQQPQQHRDHHEGRCAIKRRRTAGGCVDDAIGVGPRGVVRQFVNARRLRRESSGCSSQGRLSDNPLELFEKRPLEGRIRMLNLIAGLTSRACNSPIGSPLADIERIRLLTRG